MRDVADLHLRAMTHPAAKGERFIAVSGDAISMIDIARMLRARLGVAAKRVPRRQLPDWIVRLAAKRDPSMKQLLPLLGNIRNATSAKAARVLGWSPRSDEDTVIATAESLIRFGLLKSRAASWRLRSDRVRGGRNSGLGQRRRESYVCCEYRRAD